MTSALDCIVCSRSPYTKPKADTSTVVLPNGETARMCAQCAADPFRVQRAMRKLAGEET